MLSSYATSKDEEVSFRGKPIPKIEKQSNFTKSDGRKVIENLSKNGQSTTIEAVHMENGRFSDVKLSTGDIVDVETAIALAENKMLNGYSTGKTMNGGRVLRSMPSTDRNNTESTGMYDLPRF